MVIAKSKAEIEKMYRSGQLAAQLLHELCKMVEPGMNTLTLDRFAENWLKERKAFSPFKGYRSYPKHICTSINHQVVHGIPSEAAIMREGDIISIDCGVSFEGYVADTAATVGVGAISEPARKLIQATEQSLYHSIEQLRLGNRLYDVSYAVQSYIEPFGYTLVREFCGHGVGRKMHEEPLVPNCGKKPHTGPKLKEGWVLAVEPMVNLGVADVKTLADAWTVVTLDGKLSAHFEHTIAVTENGPRILTALNA
ncbi:MAG: type I methionyl aminopeptidase [Blastocatellia bacterium]|nr:type I methionyl aminopeptidase [Blastocatellia bacterium]